MKLIKKTINENNPKNYDIEVEMEGVTTSYKDQNLNAELEFILPANQIQESHSCGYFIKNNRQFEKNPIEDKELQYNEDYPLMINKCLINNLENAGSNTKSQENASFELDL